MAFILPIAIWNACLFWWLRFCLVNCTYSRCAQRAECRRWRVWRDRNAFCSMQVCGPGLMLSLIFVCQGLCLSLFLGAGAYAGFYFVTGAHAGHSWPMLGFVFVHWGLCWASFLYARAYVCCLMFVYWGLCWAGAYVNPFLLVTPPHYLKYNLEHLNILLNCLKTISTHHIFS